MMSRRNEMTVVLLLLVALPLAAQEGTGKFSGEASVTVIEVPVRVFDPHNGAPVIGLTPADFEILEDGEPQTITNFSEIGSAAYRPSQASDQPAAQRALQTRQVIYFLDLYLMKGYERDRALEALLAAYSTGFDGTEEVSIVTFDGTLKTHLDRSRDRRRFRRAIEEIAGIRARGLDHAVSFTSALSEEGPESGERNLDYYERRQRNREFMVELDRRVQKVGDALSVTMARYGRAEGRKALVVFTPGQPETSWAPSYSPVDFLYGDVEYPTQELWREVALEASDLSFTLYIVDTSGIGSTDTEEAAVGVDTRVFAAGELSGRIDNPQTQEEAVTSATIDLSGEQASRPANLGQWLERTRKQTLISAADLSGGQAFFTSDEAAVLEKIDNELQHWYSLAYAVEHGGDGKEYDIEVRLPGRPDLGVQHRLSYVDRPASQREGERMRSAMLFGGDANPLGIRVEVGEADSRFRLGAVGSKRVQVPFAVKIPIGRLDMVPRGDVFWGKVLITFFGNDEYGNQSRIASQEQPIVVNAEEFHRAASSGYFTYKITVEVEGGEQTVFVGVKDEISGKLSISRQDLNY